MQKNSIFLTLSSIIAGIFIAILRLIQLNYYIDGNGLPINCFLTSFLNALPAVTVIICLIIAYIISSKKMLNSDISTYHAARKDFFALMLQIISVLLIAVHSIISRPLTNEIIKHQNILELAFAAVYCIATIFSAICIYKNKSLKSAGLLSILSPLYFCLQLVEVFMANLANPVLISYSFECIALGSVALFLISQAGCMLKKDQIFTTVLTGLMAIMFAPAAFVGTFLSGGSPVIHLAILFTVIPKLIYLFPTLTDRPKKHQSH